MQKIISEIKLNVSRLILLYKQYQKVLILEQEVDEGFNFLPTYR